jgi:hypothetical protein
MATEVVAGPLGFLRAASTAGGGTALSTSAAFIQLPQGTTRVFLIPRNFATAVVAKIAVNPYLIVLRTQDDLATATDYSEAAQDNDTSTSVVLNSQGTAAQADYLFVGSHVPFRGARVVIGNTNSNASVLTVKYRKSDDTWADITATDGTTTGGATFGQTGNVTWTVPTDWKQTNLASIASPAPADAIPQRSTPLYWTRWEVSAALDSTTSATSLLAMNRSTAYSEWPAGLVIEERVQRGPGGMGCIEALTDAGTANLIVNVATTALSMGFVS